MNRYEAAWRLAEALAEASEKIARNPEAGLPSPRPYPHLARPGQAWVKAGPYWIAYRTSPHLIIAAVFYETANIPRRL
ncbi:type II toxin-antitoxin system RelE/ParE family toxin [Nitrospirillum viridazoti]|uniref:type II toxin-antitoxin system RelE/ParE family toxin n=1 Tax=Nitrospirillum viridazoti TaxID=3144925 RepID=UPI003CE5B29C